MAATRLAARNMFRLIGFSDEASVILVDDEGLETSEAFAYLTYDRVRSIVKAKNILAHRVRELVRPRPIRLLTTLELHCWQEETSLSYSHDV